MASYSFSDSFYLLAKMISLFFFVTTRPTNQTLNYYKPTMPTASIDCSQAKDILNSDGQLLSHQDNLISTPLGLTILEIQGELNLPTHVPNVAITESNREYIENFIKVDEIYDAVKFGRLEIDADETKVTLFIGKSQRLIGSIVKLDYPLAVLRVPVKTDDMTDDDEKIQLVDIVKKKMIFKQRPLPIM